MLVFFCTVIVYTEDKEISSVMIPAFLRVGLGFCSVDRALLNLMEQL